MVFVVDFINPFPIIGSLRALAMVFVNRSASQTSILPAYGKYLIVRCDRAQPSPLVRSIQAVNPLAPRVNAVFTMGSHR